jgi:flagellar basal-body rod protein FlgB
MRVEDTTMRTIEWALSAQSERQRVSAHNIANVNTPGFRSRRVDFESSLADALRNGGTGVAARSSRAAGTPTNLNGNDVLLEEETVLLKRSSLHYEALSTAMSMKFSSLRASIGR